MTTIQNTFVKKNAIHPLKREVVTLVMKTIVSYLKDNISIYLTRMITKNLTNTILFFFFEKRTYVIYGDFECLTVNTSIHPTASKAPIRNINPVDIC